MKMLSPFLTWDYLTENIIDYLQITSCVRRTRCISGFLIWLLPSYSTTWKKNETKMIKKCHSSELISDSCTWANIASNYSDQKKSETENSYCTLSIILIIRPFCDICAPNSSFKSPGINKNTYDVLPLDTKL